jgi:hypothetical protein
MSDEQPSVCPECGDRQCNFNERGSSCRRVRPGTFPAEPVPVSDYTEVAEKIGDLAHQLCEETMDDDATPDDNAMLKFEETVASLVSDAVRELKAENERLREQIMTEALSKPNMTVTG